VRAHLVRLRSGADEAAQKHGCRLMATGTHPTAHWSEQRLTDAPRYDRVHERFAGLALQQLIAGQHVHVSVDDPELAVAIIDRLRPDLPVLLALAGSSPFWEGVDTGHASYRTMWFARFPVAGSQELLGSRRAYDQAVADLVASGVVDDARGLYWDARPSLLYPTVEVRVADACPRLDDAVLQAGLTRALVRVAAAEAVRGTSFPTPRAEVVRAARWRAARFGTADRLVDLRTGTAVPAEQLVRELLDGCGTTWTRPGTATRCGSWRSRRSPAARRRTSSGARRSAPGCRPCCAAGRADLRRVAGSATGRGRGQRRNRSGGGRGAVRAVASVTTAPRR
jgi:carboxylate-amine ligase